MFINYYIFIPSELFLTYIFISLKLIWWHSKGGVFSSLLLFVTCFESLGSSGLMKGTVTEAMGPTLATLLHSPIICGSFCAAVAEVSS